MANQHDTDTMRWEGRAAAFFAVLDNYTVADLVKQRSEMKKLLKIKT